jgi:hypothetical protein
MKNGQNLGWYKGPRPRPECGHTDADECDCVCHEPTETGEPKVMHIIACCSPCPECDRSIR